MPDMEKARSPTDETTEKHGIACPNCGKIERHWVVDSRPGNGIKKRRRECICGCRFDTYESTEPPAEFVNRYSRADLWREVKPRLLENIREAILKSFKE